MSTESKEVVNILEGAPLVPSVERSVAGMGVLGKDSHAYFDQNIDNPIRVNANNLVKYSVVIVVTLK